MVHLGTTVYSSAEQLFSQKIATIVQLFDLKENSIADVYFVNFAMYFEALISQNTRDRLLSGHLPSLLYLRAE